VSALSVLSILSVLPASTVSNATPICFSDCHFRRQVRGWSSLGMRRWKCSGTPNTLATSMVGASLAKRRLRQQPVPALALVCGAAAMWLLVLGDPHGLAVLTGLALGSLSHRQARVGRSAQRVAF